MSTSRTVIELLKAYLQNKNEPLESNQKKGSRSLDHFLSPLIDTQSLNDFTEKFKNMFKEIKLIESIDEKHPLDCLSEDDKNKIRKWQTEIAEVACAELLNERREIKPEVIELLNWDQSVDDLICAYVCHVSQCVGGKIDTDFLEQYGHIFSAVYPFMNEAYRKEADGRNSSPQPERAKEETASPILSRSANVNDSNQSPKSYSRLFYSLASRGMLLFSTVSTVLTSPLIKKKETPSSSPRSPRAGKSKTEE